MSGVIPTQQSRAADQWPPQSPGQRPYPEMPEVPSDKPLLQSLGASGTAIFSGIITSEEYNPDFYWRDGIKIFEQMLRSDAQIRAVRTVVEDPIKRATWTITPGSEHPRDKEIASFVQSCLFTDMSYTTADGRVRSQTWSQILHHMLMHLWYGFMAFEVVWKKEDGWVKWAKWQPLLPRTVWRWWVGADTELVGIQQWTFKDWNYAFVDIPADKLLLFVHQQEGANFEGASLLRTAYKHWWYKQQFEKIEAIGIERNAVVPPVITLPPNFTSEDIANAQTLGANMRANELSYATLPPGMLLDYPAHMQPFTSQVQPAIQYHDVMIARNVLAQFINLGSTETGAYALADAQQEMFLQALQAVAAYISDVVSSDAIRRLVDYNFSGVEVYPRLKCSRLANADISQVADALGKLKARDANFINPSPEVEDYLAEEFGLPKPARSPVTATNPTAPTTPQRPDAQPGAGSDHADQPSRNISPAGQKPGGNDANATAAPSDGGPALAETVEDVRLLRETVEAIAGLDAVERGVAHGSWQRKLLYNPNHDPRSGEFSSGGGGGAGGGDSKARGGGRTKAGGGASKAKAEKSGEKAAPKARASRGASKATPEEDMHARSARLQREQGLPAEARPDATKMLPQFVDTDVSWDTSARTADQQWAHDIVFGTNGQADILHWSPETRLRNELRLYGESQIGARLANAPIEDLSGMARSRGVSAGGTKADLVSRITAAVTQGRYSANFGKSTSGSARSSRASRDLFAAHAAKAAKLKSALDRAEAAAEKAGGGASKAKAEKSGEKAAPKARASRGASKATPEEDMHARSARLQREQGLPAEVGPGQHIIPIQTTAPLAPSDPYSTPDMRRLVATYGEHQVGAFASQYSTATLRGIASSLGIAHPGRSRVEMVSTITAHVTHGRYSANFGKSTSGSARSSRASRDLFAAHAAKAAKLKSALDRAEAAAEKARAAYTTHMAKAPKQASEQSAHAREATRLRANVRRAEAAVKRAQVALEQA